MYLRPRRRRIPKRNICLIVNRFLALLNPAANYPQTVVKDHKHGVGVDFGYGYTRNDECVCEGEVEDQVGHGYDGCVVCRKVRRGRRVDAQQKNTCNNTRFDKQTHDFDDDSMCGR